MRSRPSFTPIPRASNPLPMAKRYRARSCPPPKRQKVAPGFVEMLEDAVERYKDGRFNMPIDHERDN